MDSTRVNRITQTASHWGVYKVETDGRGNVARTLPFRGDANPASYMTSLPDTVHSPLRITQPHVRRGFLQHNRTMHRGGEPFVPVGWDEALDLIAGELQRVKAAHGNESIYGGSYGWASAGRLHHSPSVLKRFLGLFGGYVDKRGNHSFGAALHIAPYVIGRADITELVVSWPDIVANANLVVMFGGAALKNSQIDPGGAVNHETQNWFGRAAEAPELRFVNISPSRQDLPAELKSDWIPLRPNTDTAFMLGLAHTLASEGLASREFLEKYCEGYDRFESYLLGREDGIPKDAGWACSITQVPADIIQSLARRMAASRTLITTSWSVQRAEHGEQPIWMTITLAAMLGQIGTAGCGFTFGFGAANGITVPHRTDLPRPTLPLGPNPIKTYVPVGRVGDMLLRPGAQIQYNGKCVTYPDTRLLYSIGGNPFHHNGNLNRFLKAWQRPEVIVVHEPWWNPPAKHADIVLPATTTMERNDILAHEHTPYWIAMKQVIEPVGQARNDFDIMASLAQRLDFGLAYTEGRDEMGWLRHMYEGARGKAQALGFAPPEFEDFWRAGEYEIAAAPRSTPPLLGEFRRDPLGHPLATPSGKIEIFSATIGGYGYADCPPHPAWLEPSEWLGSAQASIFSLHLLSNQPRHRLHSQLDHSTVSRQSKVSGREPLYIHPDDAKCRGLSSGDIVRVFNSRGAFLAGLEVVDHILPGVVQIATGAWYDPECGGVPGSLEKHGNPNVVTQDGGTSQLGQGSVVQTVLVEIEKCENPPEVSAYEPPLFERAGP